MLYTSGTTARPKGRAAPPARRARRRARPCGAKSLWPARAHARRHAALPHHGRALAHRHVADRRRLRLPAALRRRPRARADRGRAHHQSLSRADALSRPPARRAIQDRRRQLRAQARLRRRFDDGRPAQGAEGCVQAGPVRQSLRLVGDLHLHHRPERAGKTGFGRPRRHQPDGARGAARRQLARGNRGGRRGRRDHRAHGGRRILRGLLAAARCRRQGVARRLVFHRRHRLCRRRRRSLRHRPRRRHDHHRRREHLAGRDRKLPVAASRGLRGGRGRPRRRALGQDRLRVRQAAHRGRARGARSILPPVRARQFQAAAPLCLRRSDSEIAGRQAVAPQAGGGRIRAGAQPFSGERPPPACQQGTAT